MGNSNMNGNMNGNMNSNMNDNVNGNVNGNGKYYPNGGENMHALSNGEGNSINDGARNGNTNRNSGIAMSSSGGGEEDFLFGMVFDQAPPEAMFALHDNGDSNDKEDHEEREKELRRKRNDQLAYVPHNLQGSPKVEEDGSVPLLELLNFKDNDEEYDFTDVSVFLHIPKAGGSTVKNIIGSCHRLVMATNVGI